MEGRDGESAAGNYTPCTCNLGVSPESLPFVLQSIASEEVAGARRRDREEARGKRRSGRSWWVLIFSINHLTAAE